METTSILLGILKLLIPIAVMMALLVFKVHIAAAILACGVLMGYLFGIAPPDLGLLALKATVDKETIRLVVVVYMVLTLVQVMKAKDSLSHLVKALRGLLKKKLWIITASPAVIGLLPMPAGALLPAPILNETLRGDPVSPTYKTYINYWFRHIWEYSWPLSQGVIITAAIFHVDLFRVSLYTSYYPLLSILIGVVFIRFFTPPLQKERPIAGSLVDHFSALAAGVWEIALIILLVMVGKIPPHYAMPAVVLFSWAVLPRRVPWRERWLVFRRSFNVSLLVTTVCIMVFSFYIDHSHIKDFSRVLIAGAGQWQFMIMFFVPFLIGFLTGISNAFAGIALPLFVSTVGNSHPDLVKIAYLYVSGFCGVLLSPVHFCLVLTTEFYHARLKDVYKYLIPSVTVVALVATAIYLLLRG